MPTTEDKRLARNAYAREWRAANADLVRARQRDVYDPAKAKEDRRRWQPDPEKQKARTKRYTERNPERVKAAWKKQNEAQREKRAANRLANIDHVRAKQRAAYAANPTKWLASSRKSSYGITPAQFDAMITAQGNRCPICSIEFDGSPRQQHVDHCHETGVVRGILCRDCNLGLGRFADNTANLQGAIEYLVRAGGN